MGLNYTSTVIIGFIIETEKVKKKVQKFDPDTGDPIEIEIFSHERYLSQGKVIIDEPGESLYTGDQYRGMVVIESGYDNGTQILGVVLAKADDHNPVAEVKDLFRESIAVTPFSVKHKLEPTVYVVQSC